MVDRVVVHIGTEKTGSTSIQANLAANREELGRHGVVVPKSPGVDGNAWHVGLAAAFCDVRKLQDLGRWFGIDDRASQDEFRRNLEQRIRSEIRADEQAVAVVFSSEHVHSRFVTAGAVERLHAFLATLADEVECVAYLTRQDRLAVSKASTSTRAGAVIPSRVFPNVVAPGGSLQPFYDYNSLWQRIRGAFGDKHVRLRLLRKDDHGVSDVVDDFFALLDIDATSLRRAPRQNTALRLNPAGLAAYSLISQRHGRLAGDFAAQNLHAKLATLAPGHGFRSIVPRSAAEEFAARFDAGNSVVADEANGGMALFDDDFSEYPDRGEAGDNRPLHEEASQLLVELLGLVGEENARLRRQVQLFRQQAPGLPPLRAGDLVDAPRALELADAKRRIEPAAFDRDLTFGRGWQLDESGAWMSASTAELWMLIANPRARRTLEVRVESTVPSGSTGGVGYELRCGRRNVKADWPVLQLEVDAGYSLVYLSLTLGAGAAGPADGSDPTSRAIGLTGIELQWPWG